ncbi:MAG: HAMP domain-containing histidine kinase [Clostridiales bacterium]|nr:HAMP domain-containing histidine kinase [Clostridiales bacterium]
MKRFSISTRITLWFTSVLIVVVAITYFVILSVSGQTIQKTIRDNLILTVENNIDEIEYYSSYDSLNTDSDVDFYIYYNDGYIEVDDDFLDKVNQIYTSLCEEDGTMVYGINPIAREIADLPFEDSEIQKVTVDGTLYYVFDRKLDREGLETLWLRGIVSETQGAVTLSAISRTSLIILPSLLVLAIIGGYLIARRALRPIRQISDTASQIRQGDDLKKRIDLGEGNDELHRLADQFNEMFTRLDQSFTAQQEFVADASHELRTPVAVINAQCELSLEDTQSTEEYEEALQVIQRQGRKMNRLISNMLDFTRLELQPERYPKEDIDFSALVESVCFDMALLRTKNISLTCEAEKDLHVTGSRELLTRLLSNLISNAYRYGREDGYIKVRLHAEEDLHSAREISTGKEPHAAGYLHTFKGSPGNRKLHENSMHDNKKLHTENSGFGSQRQYAINKTIIFSVEDNGIGIAPENIPKIFQRFYQADASHAGEGSGLGLAMVKEIAEFHGGVVSAESKPGKGSTFYFRI